MKMKKILCLAAFLFLSGAAMAQYAYRIVPVTALPATCNPANGDVRYLTTGAQGVYKCGPALNTWQPISLLGIGNQLVINQGTLTGASTPFITHTATWNNAATTFVNFNSDVTDTASAAGSILFRLQVGGVTEFEVSKFGGVTANGTMTVNAPNAFNIGGRSQLFSGADGRWNMTNLIAADFARLTLGPEAVTYPSLTVSPAVAGQTQGIIIQRGDGTDQTFAGLGAAANGSMIFCSDCTIANPCAGAGTGAIAKRLNGVWVCN